MMSGAGAADALLPSGRPPRALQSLKIGDLLLIWIPICALPVGLFPREFRQPCAQCGGPLAFAIAMDPPKGFVGLECELGHVAEYVDRPVDA
jgi:hypothetical protein